MASTVYLITMTIMAIFIAFEPTFAQFGEDWKATLYNQATDRMLDSNEIGDVYTQSPNGGDFQAWTKDTSSNGCVKFKNFRTGRCLDSNHDGNVYALECNGGNYQNWRYYNMRLVNCETNLCLDSNSAGSVYTLNCNGGNFQNWIKKTLRG